MIDGLKPCPFCGGEAAFHEHERVGVECIECGAGFACVYRDRDEAAEEWNRREGRTCRMEAHINGEYRCGECGHLNRETYRADKGWYPPEYCAHCGARVMDA